LRLIEDMDIGAAHAWRHGQAVASDPILAPLKRRLAFEPDES
jgi:molybdenum cofactor biosynthesis enzyme MoaA